MTTCIRANLFGQHDASEIIAAVFERGDPFGDVMFRPFAAQISQRECNKSIAIAKTKVQHVSSPDVVWERLCGDEADADAETRRRRHRASLWWRLVPLDHVASVLRLRFHCVKTQTLINSVDRELTHKRMRLNWRLLRSAAVETRQRRAFLRVRVARQPVRNDIQYILFF